MSTKIWEAYALKPRRDVWNVCMGIRRQAVKRVKQTLAKVYAAVIASPGDFLTERQREKYGSIKTLLEASSVIRRLFAEQSNLSERNAFDLQVSLAIRRTDTGRWLVIPYSGSGLLSGTLSFLRKHRDLVDYHYQDQTDMPSNVSRRQWSERRDTWSPLLADKRWAEMFVVEVTSPTIHGWLNTCPAFDVMQKQFAAVGRKTRP